MSDTTQKPQENSQAEDKPHNMLYFQPGQIIFHAQGNLSDTSALDELINWANELAAGNGYKLLPVPEVFDFDPQPYLHEKKINPEGKYYSRQVKVANSELPLPKDKSISAPPLKVPPPFSLVFAEVTRSPDSQDQTDLKNLENFSAQVDFFKFVLFLDERRESAPVRLEVVSPNWLMSSGKSEPGATGGPGGKPEHVDPADIGKYNFTLNSSNPLLISKPDSGKDVVVAILDTSYGEKQLIDFYQKWVLDVRNVAGQPNSVGTQKPHPIVDALLRYGTAQPGAMREANGSLRVYLDPDVDRYVGGIQMDRYDYDMTDHGLFVAGIVNSLAPQAEIHLFQVLNHYGLGDLRSIARALQMVTDKFKDRSLVINLSLTMNLPMDERNLKGNDAAGLGRAILSQKPWWLARLVSDLFNRLFGKPLLCCCDTWYERQAMPLEWICDLIYTLDSRIIAAAGNESTKGQKRPQALFPAAFERVLGVGALARDNSPASYSNLADIPARIGVTTLGGEAGQRNGVLGVYLGEFPNNTHVNDNGWAWWSGTSFATPIISGLTAAALGSLASQPAVGTPAGANRRPATQTAIDAVYNTRTGFNGDDEAVVSISQG